MSCCTKISNYLASTPPYRIAISAVIEVALLIIGSLCIGGILTGLPIGVGYFFVCASSAGLITNFLSLLAKGCTTPQLAKRCTTPQDGTTPYSTTA